MSARAASSADSAGCDGSDVVVVGGTVVVVTDVVVVDGGALDAELCEAARSSLLHADAKAVKGSKRYTARRRIEAESRVPA
jgi:hypothetical protein